MSNLDRLLALHEWVGLLDGGMVAMLTNHFVLCIGSILQLGEARPALSGVLDELDSMRSFGVFLATELGYGNNLQRLETEAVYDHKRREFVLHTPSTRAQKFMSNSGAEDMAKLAVVMARLKVDGVACGVYPFVVRIRTSDGLCPGVHVFALGNTPELALDNAMVIFEHVRVPFEHWLSGGHSRIDRHGKFSSAIASPALRFLSALDRVQLGKLCLTHVTLAGMRASLDLTRRYAEQRRTFAPGRRDVRLLQYRTYQRALVSGIAATYATSFFAQHVRAKFSDTQDAQHWLTALKVYASKRGLQVFQSCRERLGAQGMFSANRVISYMMHVQGVMTAEGDNEVMLLRMARQLLQQSSLDSGASVANPGVDDDVANVISLLASYEDRFLQRLRATGASGVRGESIFDIWNDQAPEALELASLHVERLALQAFAKQHAGLAHAEVKALLRRVLRLCALQALTEHLPGLIAEELVGAEQIRRILREREHELSSLCDHIGALTEAAEVPTTFSGAPIAADYLAAYDRMTP